MLTSEVSARGQKLKENARRAAIAGSKTAGFIFGDVDVIMDPVITSDLMRDEELKRLEEELEVELEKFGVEAQ